MSNFVVMLINILFLFFLLFVASGFIASKFSRKKTSEEEQFTAVKRIGLITIPVLFGIIIALAVISYSFNISIRDKDEKDLANWTSLVIEIGLGIVVGLSIFIYSNIEQTRSNKIIHEQKTKSEKRKNFAINQIRYKLSFSYDVCPDGQAVLDTGVIENLNDRQNAIGSELSNLPYVIDELNNVQNIVSLYAEDLDPDDVDQIMRITQYSQQFARDAKVLDDRLWRPLNDFKSNLDEFFKKYPKLDWIPKQDEILG